MDQWVDDEESPSQQQQRQQQQSLSKQTRCKNTNHDKSTTLPLSKANNNISNNNNNNNKTSKYATFLLVLSISLIHSDQNLLSPNLTAAAIDLNITDPTERDAKLGGGLAFGLFLVGAPAALIIGAKSDGLLQQQGRGGGGGREQKSKRSDLLAMVLLIGALGCTGSAISQTYPQIFVARAITGVSLAGGLPLAMSLVGDMYSSDRRTTISAWLGVAMNIGAIGGQFLAGWIGESLGWRSPFWIVGFCMCFVAFVVKKTLPEPVRVTTTTVVNGGDGDDGIMLTSSSTREGNDGVLVQVWNVVKKWTELLRIRTFWLLMLQGVPGCIPWGVIATFLPDYLHVDAGLTVHEATLVMTTFQFGGIAGTFISGEIGQRLYNKSPKLPAAYMFIVGNIGIAPMWYLITSTPQTTFRCSVAAALGGFFASQTGPNVRATLSNVTNSTQRGLAFASFVLFDDVGKGAGPVFVAALISSYGRQAAFATSMLCWAPCAILCGCTAWTVLKDERVALSSHVSKVENEDEDDEEEIELQSQHLIV